MIECRTCSWQDSSWFSAHPIHYKQLWATLCSKLEDCKNDSKSWTIKTYHFVFDYNSGVSCSIFIIFIPVETGRNTLQYIYLIALWRHNSVKMHVTKVYFIQLVHKIKYVEFEDRPTNFFIKTCWNVKIFLPEDWQKNVLPKIRKYEHWTIFCESCEQPVRSNALWWLTSKCAVYMSF